MDQLTRRLAEAGAALRAAAPEERAAAARAVLEAAVALGNAQYAAECRAKGYTPHEFYEEHDG